MCPPAGSALQDSSLTSLPKTSEVFRRNGFSSGRHWGEHTRYSNILRSYGPGNFLFRILGKDQLWFFQNYFGVRRNGFGQPDITANYGSRPDNRISAKDGSP